MKDIDELPRFMEHRLNIWKSYFGIEDIDMRFRAMLDASLGDDEPVRLEYECRPHDHVFESSPCSRERRGPWPDGVQGCPAVIHYCADRFECDILQGGEAQGGEAGHGDSRETS